MALSIEVNLKIKELELNSLFETIQAINANASEEDLYKIYSFIVRSNQHIQRMALYVLDEEWECKAFYGTTHDYETIKLPDSQASVGAFSTNDHQIKQFQEFNKIIPIAHKERFLAYVFLGYQDEEDEAMLGIDFLEALCNIIIVAIENKKLVRKEVYQRNYQAQLEIAQEVQSSLFPNSLPYRDEIMVEASYLPHHRIGGDYYDYLELEQPDSFLVCVADVSGKGVPASILMSNFQAGLRLLAHQNLSLIEIVTKLNALIMLNSQGTNFITAFFLIYNYQTKSIEYINAGHNPPFLFVDNQVTLLEEGTTVLGGFEELPFLESTSISDLDKFFLFAFTDGFTETYNEEGQEFGEDYLLKFVEEHLDEDQKSLHVKLINHLKTFKGNNEYADDITLFSCKVDLSS